MRKGERKKYSNMPHNVHCESQHVSQCFVVGGPGCLAVVVALVFFSLFLSPCTLSKRVVREESVLHAWPA